MSEADIQAHQESCCEGAPPVQSTDAGDASDFRERAFTDAWGGRDVPVLSDTGAARLSGALRNWRKQGAAAWLAKDDTLRRDNTNMMCYFHGVFPHLRALSAAYARLQPRADARR